jgi:hypothetical protein
MNPNNRKQLLMIIAIVMVGLWVADKVIFTPLTNLYKARSLEAADLRKYILENKGKIQQEPIMQRRWDDMSKRTLPQTTSEAEGMLFNAIEKWKQDTRVTVNTIRPQWKSGASDDYSVLECRIDAAGTMDTIARFVDQIEHSSMALKVESMEVTTSDKNGQQMTLALMISGLRLAGMEAK